VTTPTAAPNASPTITGAPIVQPNLYQLSGRDVHVTYSRTSLTGQPQFLYQDRTLSKVFAGDQIETVEVPALGEIVSVTISQTVDLGSTTFSVLLPFVNLLGHTSAAVHTEGITTMHRTSLAPPLNQGQRETYVVTALRGTASQVQF
jgi:hypothetical protein